MTNEQIAHKIAIRLNAAEDQLSSIELLVTEDFIDGIGGHKIYDPLLEKLNSVISAVDELHAAALEASKNAGDITIYSGGGGGK